MKKDLYRYSASLTSQLPFCATPLRLDSFNNCAFGCAYCFAKTRQGFGREQALKIAKPDILAQRLERVLSKGKVCSALDEFISKRIPFQLGGMSDPFSKFEENFGITLEYLKILNSYSYPFIISTKAITLTSDNYLNLLEKSNCYVRFSTTVIDEKHRHKVDRNCPSISKILEASFLLSSCGIPVSLRFQPIIPGHESFSEDLLYRASEKGVKHISTEYLKVPIDANIKFGSSLKFILSDNPVKHYMSLGAKKAGRELSLPLSIRQEPLLKIYEIAKKLRMSFGFADNDILHYSDGNSCCGAADLYLKDANFFRGNIMGVIKNKKTGDKIFFSELLSHWLPQERISSYLNSKARIKTAKDAYPEWVYYLMKIWSGELGLYSPSFFDGIEKHSEVDEFNLPVYVKEETQLFKKIQDINIKVAHSVRS